MVVDLLLGGSNFSKTLTEANMVRREYEPTIATTLSVPFYGMQLYAVCAYIYCQILRIRIPAIVAWLTWTVISCRYILSILSANRQIFYIGLCWYVLCLLLIWRFRRLRHKLARLFLLLTMGSIAAVYIVFIAAKRSDESYLIETTKNLPVRYDVSAVARDSLIFAGILQLDDYPSHVFAAIDRILERAPAVNCDPSRLFLWFITTEARLSGNTVSGSTPSNYSRFMESCDVPSYMWPSIFGDGAYCFGIWGFPVVLAGVGYFYGRCYRCFTKAGSFLAFYWFFVIFNYLIMGHMMFVGDVIMNMALLLGAALFFWKRFLRNQGRQRSNLQQKVGNGLPPGDVRMIPEMSGS
jgi:hypothetical protein